MKMNERDLISRRYLVSLYIDWLMFFVLILTVFLLSSLNILVNDFDKYVHTLIIVLFGIFFISDWIFKNRSLGKRFMGIEIVNVTDKENVKLSSIVTRRLYEFTWHPLIHRKSFQEKCKEIESTTGTKIVLKGVQK